MVKFCKIKLSLFQPSMTILSCTKLGANSEHSLSPQVQFYLVQHFQEQTVNTPSALTLIKSELKCQLKGTVLLHLKSLIFQNLDLARFKRFKPSSCKDLGIKRLEFEGKYSVSLVCYLSFIKLSLMNLTDLQVLPKHCRIEYFSDQSLYKC